MNDFIYENETSKIREALFEVYKHLGSGFLEAVYQEAVEIEFRIGEIPFQPNRELLLHTKIIP